MENKETEAEVLVFKFVSGEEVIGRVVPVPESPGALFIRDTYLVMLRVNPQNPQNIGFNIMPWSPLAGEMKNINPNAILFSSVPRDELLQAYNEATGAIVVPPKGLIV